MTRRHTISRNTGIIGITVFAAWGLFTATPVHADDPADDAPTETPAPEPADDPVETGEVDGDVVAVGLPPVPPTPVETGVDDDGSIVAVGTPPVPPTTAETGQVDGATVAVGRPPVPSTPVETGVDDDGAIVAVGTPPVPTTPRRSTNRSTSSVRRQVPAAVTVTPALLRSTADAAFDAIDAWF